MKILILGSDGYIGWPLTIHLLKRGHEVAGLDDYSRRRRVKDVGSDSLTPIKHQEDRVEALKHRYPRYYGQLDLSLGQTYNDIKAVLLDFKPDAIVHLAEQPSAPWSMQDVFAAKETQEENVLGTLHLLWAMKEVCPSAHLLKLGTMGEYGTPECDIPEGKIPRECIRGNWNPPVECPMSGLLFPRSPGSFYHLSKVHDTHNILFACHNWGLRSTDIMQGVVFGLMDTDPELITRFDYDEFFGTVINRFCTQALINMSLTVYGKGKQKRGFLPLKDSIQCLTIALENPPVQGEYRTLNQFENVYILNDLADMVAYSATNLGLNPSITHLPNPRNEAEIHYYNPEHQKLFNLGYMPTTNIQHEITTLLEQLLPYKDRVIKEAILPTTKWR